LFTTTYPTRLSVAIIGTLLVAAYLPTCVKLTEYWANNDMYSYGFAIVPISALMVWAKRRELEGVETAPDYWPGGVLFASGLLMLLAGRASSTNLVEEMSLVVTVAGLTWLLLGTDAFRILWFPLAYLVAMIPFWEFLTNGLQPYFQLYSATVGVNVLRSVGVPVLRDGFTIHLPNANLEVAEACSGINYLISVYCIGIPLTALLVRSWPKRIFIMLTTAVIALVSNGLRVAIVSSFAYMGIRGPNGDIHGPYALFRSLLISGVGFAAMFGLVFWLADRDVQAATSIMPSPGEPVRGLARLSPRPLSALLAILMLSAFVGFDVLHRVSAVPLRSELQQLPPRVGGWRAYGLAVQPNDVEALPFDEKLTSSYVAVDGTELGLFLGYLGTQADGRELAGYAMRAALSGREHSQYLVGSSDVTPINDFLTTTGGTTSYVSYWYVLNGRIVAADYQAKLLSAWDSIVYGRNNGAVVVLRSPLRQGETLDAARARLHEFVLGFVPVSREYAPRL
jgi:EpsI family protein